MGFLFFLVLSFGAFVVSSASQCVPETARCSEFWTKIAPHKNLWETEGELNSWCRVQDRFYECLEEILLEGKNGNMSHLPINLLVSKLFAKDLCTDASHSRRRLLDNAACINNLKTDICNLPEFLDIVTPDGAIPATRCSFPEKSFSCIAATLVLNCGFDAGRVFRNLLKITRYSDEVCGIEVTEGIPSCDEQESSETRADRIAKISYELARRIGRIPEQENELEGSSKESRGRGSPQIDINQAVNEVILGYLDRMGGISDQENEIRGSSIAQGQRVAEEVSVNKAVEVMQKYLDGIGSVEEQENEIRDSSNEAQGGSNIGQIAVNEAIREYLDRMGSVPEQENEIHDSPEAQTGRGSGQIDASQVVDVIQEYLDRLGSESRQDNEIQGSSNEVHVLTESERIDGNKAVTEALENALNSLDNAVVVGSESQQDNEIPVSSQGLTDSKHINANQAVIDVMQEYIDRIGSVPELENEIQGSSNEAHALTESERIDGNKAVTEALENALNSLDNAVVVGSESQQDNEIPVSSRGLTDSKQINANQAVIDVMQEYIDRIGSVPELENEIQGSSNEARVLTESERIDGNKAVTEALENSLNSLDNAMVEESEVDYMMADDSKVNDELYMNPIITEVYKGILFYNYSGVEYALYWRQPHFTGIENVTCGQLDPPETDVLACAALNRYKDPDCSSKTAVHERVTPELIRDLDPEVSEDSVTEFGPRPHWMKNMDDAKEAKRLRDLAKVAEETVQVTESPDTSTAATILHIASNVFNKTENWYDMDWMGKYTNSLIPNDVHLELMELFLPEAANYKSPPLVGWRSGHVYYSLIYDPDIARPIEKATCSRLDECHPRGWGLWKCKILARKTKPCDECHESVETRENSDFVTETSPTTVLEGSEIVESSKTFSSVERESVQDHDENSKEYDPSIDGYINDEFGDMNDEYRSEEDDLSEMELKEAIAEEINYKLETETDQQLKNDFRLLLLDSVLHPSRYEYLSKPADENDVQIEDEYSEWSEVPEEDESKYSDALIIKPISEDDKKVAQSIKTRYEH